MYSKTLTVFTWACCESLAFNPIYRFLTFLLVSLLASAAPIASPEAVLLRDPDPGPVPAVEPDIAARICKFSCGRRV